MHMTRWSGITLLVIVFVIGVLVGQAVDVGGAGATRTGDEVFELRTYTANQGKLAGVIEELRFAAPIFERYGMKNIGYWVPVEEPLSNNTLIYLLRYDSREAAETGWESFLDDPEWRAAFEEFNKDGRLVAGVNSIFVRATDFSPVQ